MTHLHFLPDVLQSVLQELLFLRHHCPAVLSGLAILWRKESKTTAAALARREMAFKISDSRSLRKIKQNARSKTHRALNAALHCLSLTLKYIVAVLKWTLSG